MEGYFQDTPHCLMGTLQITMTGKLIKADYRNLTAFERLVHSGRAVLTAGS